MSRQSLVKARSFYVATEYFCASQGSYVMTKCFYATTKLGQEQEFLCRDKIFSCHDKVGQGEENLCRDRVFLALDGVFMSQQRIFVS